MALLRKVVGAASARQDHKGAGADRRLEFNLAGWTMNDEAAPTYSAAINQMTEGHPFVLRNSVTQLARPWGGTSTRFGHVASTASVWSDMGFDAFGLERIDEREKNRRRADRRWSSSGVGRTWVARTNFCAHSRPRTARVRDRVTVHTVLACVRPTQCPASCDAGRWRAHDLLITATTCFLCRTVMTLPTMMPSDPSITWIS